MWYKAPTMLPAGSIVGALYHKLQTQSSAPEDGRNYRPKQVELIEIINKPLLLHLVGYLYYWQMGFNSVFKGLIKHRRNFNPCPKVTNYVSHPHVIDKCYLRQN